MTISVTLVLRLIARELNRVIRGFATHRKGVVEVRLIT
jgi:hypothetical protein